MLIEFRSHMLTVDIPPHIFASVKNQLTIKRKCSINQSQLENRKHGALKLAPNLVDL